MTPAEKIANAVAADLLTSGNGIADHLWLGQGSPPDGKYLGGLADYVVRRRIRDIVQRELLDLVGPVAALVDEVREGKR